MSIAANRPPLDADALRRALVLGAEGGDPNAFWSRLDVVQETGSTNADLLARAAEPGNDRSVLIAEFQGAGRGRHSRTWVSPPQAQIAMSVLLTLPGMDLHDMGWLPLLAGVATVDAIRSVAQVPAELKWPNDVLIDGRKVAGILAELAARWQQWFDAGWSVTDLAAAYRARCGTLGQRVRALLPGDKELVGSATDIDAQGQLVITPDAAAAVAVAAGDITHLRPVGTDPKL